MHLRRGKIQINDDQNNDCCKTAEYTAAQTCTYIYIDRLISGIYKTGETSMTSWSHSTHL